MAVRLFGALLVLGGCPSPPGEADADLDGYVASEDCNDSDPDVNPGVDEVCANGVDDDCDGLTDEDGVGATTFFPDDDADGYGGTVASVTACTAPVGYVPNDDDCDDADPDINPGAADDQCDRIDNDCDGSFDEQAESLTVYVDGDGDGFGAGAALEDCRVDPGFSPEDTDCDDAVATTNPDAPEACNGIDDNCALGVDEGVLGSGLECPAESCLAVFEDQPDAESGEYWLDFAEPHAFTCDMDTDGGGWTVVTGMDLRTLDLVAFERINGAAGFLRMDYVDDVRVGGFYLDPRRANLDREDCATAVLRATVELPFDFDEWRGRFDVQHYGQDNVSVAPGALITACDEGAFLFTSGFDVVKRGGTWGTSNSDVRTVAWPRADLGTARNSFFWELNGYNTTSFIGEGEEFAVVTGIEIFRPVSSSPASHGVTMAVRLFGALLVLGGCPSPPGEADADLDGYVASEDCNDSDPDVNPGVDEVCANGVDDDCDGLTDEDGVGATTFFPDDDADGYGGTVASVTACTAPVGYVPNDDDCDDADPDINPGAADDQCDRIDNDCDGSFDEQAESLTVYVDGDGDGFGAGAALEDCRVDPGFSAEDTDCDDAVDTTNPDAPEACNGIDDNCALGVDEGVLGSGLECPAESCLAVFEDQPDAESGEYWLDFAEPHAFTCDMDIAGGGWTVITGMDLRTLDLVRFRLVGGTAGFERMDYVDDVRIGGFFLDPRRSQPDREDCVTAVLRATVELPFDFDEWRGRFDVQHYGQDNTFVIPGQLIRECDKGAFQFGAGPDLPKSPGTWGSSDSDVRTVSWPTRDVGLSLRSFFWELNGYNTTSFIGEGEEFAVVTGIEISVR